MPYSPRHFCRQNCLETDVIAKIADVLRNLSVDVYQRLGVDALLNIVNAAKIAGVVITVNAVLTVHASKLQRLDVSKRLFFYP